MQTLLEAAFGKGLPKQVVMLQGSGSFFAYAPVLKALQRAEMPLRHLLPLPASQEQLSRKRELCRTSLFDFPQLTQSYLLSFISHLLS